MGDIVIAKEAWDQFESYVDLIDQEIAAFGYCKEIENGDIFVDEIFLVPQKVSGTSVDFTSDGLAHAVKKAAEDGRSEDLRFCIHSHVDMSASFSQDDHEMVGKMGKVGAPWFASVIFNKKRATAGRIDMFDLPVAFDRIHVEVDVKKHQPDKEFEQRLTEIEEFVEIKKFEAPKNYKHTKTNRTNDASERQHQWASDVQLIETAKHEGWEAVVKDGVAYFWDPESGEFKGDAFLSPDDEKRIRAEQEIIEEMVSDVYGSGDLTRLP